MSAGIFFYKNFWIHLCIMSLVMMAASCTVVKNAPANKPFVYKTNIRLIGNFTNEERQSLTSKLKMQLDDSLKSRSVAKLLVNVIKNPPLYQTVNADRTVLFMRSLLVSLGYFNDSISYTALIDSSEKNQLRTTVNFFVQPGKAVHIDSFAYNIRHPELQQLALSSQNEAKVGKGSPFAKVSISEELDRLVTLYRNNGYMRFGREELVGLWDTLDVSFLRPVFDPLEQLELLQKLKQRRENPTANLEIKLRPGTDTAKLRKYYVGNITLYPDFSSDSSTRQRQETTINDLRVISFHKMFRPLIFPSYIFLKHGQVYDHRNYFRTINRLNSLGTWRLVNISQQPRKNEDTADFIIRLTPAKKYSFVANLEGSRNNSAISGNLAGFALNFGLQNKNFAKSANQTSTNFRFGIETGRDTGTSVKFIQSRILSVSHSITFPRPVPEMKWLPEKIRNGFRTVLAFNAGLTERRLLYNLKTLNGSWGYEFQWDQKFMFLRFPNIEYSSFTSRPLLDSIFSNNPSLKNIFSTGLISSVMTGMRITGGRKKSINTLAASLEFSGLISGLIRNKFFDENLFRFLKLDIDFSRKISFGKPALVLHGFAGIGYALESTVNPGNRYNLPLLRQYFSGGPGSMRAWGLRKLGPGSYIRAFDSTGLPDRYGDLQLEANIEYRFPFFRAFGFNFEGALFTDIGNIWYMKDAPMRPDEEVFHLSRLGNDLAVGVGGGLRIDLSFFVIRLDYSIKAKDPSPSPVNAFLQNKWFGYKSLKEADQFQLAISYPFVL